MLKYIVFFVSIAWGLLNPLRLFAEDFSYRVGIYGISNYFQFNASGDPYYKQNYGLSFSIPLRLFSWPIVETKIEVGAFRNSFDDFALWAGVGILYSVDESLDVGLRTDHWHTKQNTYARRVLTLYPTTKFYFTNNFAVKTHFSKNSVVASFELPLDSIFV